MERSVRLFAVVAILFMLTGCEMAGFGRPFVVGMTNEPFYILKGIEYQIDREDFEIIGPVTAEAELKSFVGFGFGDAGFELLWQEAVKMGADDLINIKWDVEYTNILFVIFTRAKIRLYATAIKWKKQPGES